MVQRGNHRPKRAPGPHSPADGEPEGSRLTLSVNLPGIFTARTTRKGGSGLHGHARFR